MDSANAISALKNKNLFSVVVVAVAAEPRQQPGQRWRMDRNSALNAWREVQRLMDWLLRRSEEELEWVRSVNYYSVQIEDKHNIFSMSYERNMNPNERNVCRN